MTKVVCNASPIIGLIIIDELKLLWELFEETYIPQAVYNELTTDKAHHNNQILQIQNAVDLGKIKVFKVKNQEFITQLSGRLHAGEIEVIVGAKELEITTVVIDEKAARNLALSMLLSPIGIIGIIQLAKKLHKIDEVKKYLDVLIENRYRISPELYERALKKAGEK